MGLNVLITNLLLYGNSGTEVVVSQLADGLLAAGHRPMLFATVLGPRAGRLRQAGHVVTDRIEALPARPDVIHAQHIPAALIAMTALPEVPVVFASHAAFSPLELPLPHPQIRRVIAVDELVAQRCIAAGSPPELLRIVLNAVDMARFRPRPRLPRRPRKALLLTKNSGHIPAVRTACAATGLALDELGPGTGRVSDTLEAELPRYDLVFATARMALEAAAVGCAVVVADERGFAGMLTGQRLELWRRRNFGAGLLLQPVTEELLRDAIDSYDATDAARVSRRLRAEATLEQSVADHVAVYREAIAAPAPTPHDVHAANAAWLQDMLTTPRLGDWLSVQRELVSLLR